MHISITELFSEDRFIERMESSLRLAHTGESHFHKSSGNAAQGQGNPNVAQSDKIRSGCRDFLQYTESR